MKTMLINPVRASNYRINLGWSLLAVFLIVDIASAIAGGKWLLLLLAVAPLLIYLSIIKPFVFPFGLYCFLVPFDFILAVGGLSHGATINKFLGIASILALSLSGLFEKKLIKPEKIVIWWGLFVLIGVLSVFWAIKPELMYSRIPTATGLFLLYLVVASYKVTEEDFAVVKKMIVYGGVSASLYVSFLYYFERVTYLGTGRASLSAGMERADPNLFAYTLLVPFALAMSAAYTQRNTLTKLLHWFLLGILAFGILITGSRGALLGIIIILFTFLFSGGKKHLLVPTAAISLIVLHFAPQMVFERITESVQTGGAGRLVIWSTGIDALKHYAVSGYYGLVGIGLDNFPTIFLHYGPLSRLTNAPHNSYLGVIVESGIIGFLFMLVAIYKHYRLIANRYCRYDHNSLPLKAAFLGLMVSAFFLDVIWKKSFWLIWILILMYNNVRKAKESSTRGTTIA